MHSAKLLLLAIIASGLLLPLNSLGKENLNAELVPETNHLDSNPQQASSLPLQASQTDTIVIQNNTDFARVAEQKHWPGNGTSANPYRIEGLTITLEVQFIAIYSSTVHFVIQNCEFSATEAIKIVTLFKTQNARIDHCTFRASTGIVVTSSGNNSIVNNKMVGSRIRIFNSESMTISNNTFESIGVPTQEYSTPRPALYIEDSQQLVISGNNFTRNGIGISMRRGNDSIFTQNILFNNIGGGMSFGDCGANVITQNILFNNTGGGMSFGDCGANVIKDNSFYYGGLIFGGSALENYLQNCENNSYNNRSLVYLRDISNVTLLSPGQVILVSCTDMAVENEEFDCAPIILAFSQRITIANSSSRGGPYGALIINSSQISLFASHIRSSSGYGVRIHASANVTLRECRITNNDGGIRLVSDSDVAIRNTTIAENKGSGIAIDYSENVTIRNTSIAENKGSGIAIDYSGNVTIRNSSISESETGISIWGNSTNNTISNCSLYSNSLGIMLDYNSSSNEVIWNNFAGKPDEEREIWEPRYFYTSQAVDHGINNVIDGNFWWDWLSPDNNDDGVVDLPYVLDGTADNQDRQPQTRFIGYLPPVFLVTPDNVFYELNETGYSLEWLVLGSAPSTFTITRDGDIIDQGSWESGSSIQISLDGLSEGIYHVTLMVEDEKHSTNQHSVRVQVVNYAWSFSISDRLTWTYTTSRDLEKPYNMSMDLNVPIGNQTTIVDVTVQENDSFHYVITSFKILNVEEYPMPIAFGDLTVNGVTGINHFLTVNYWRADWSIAPDQLVLPANVNWTAFTEIQWSGWQFSDWELVILKDTEDLFEYKFVRLQEPSMVEKSGYLYRYDKRRGILLHQEHWNEGIRIELDFDESPDLASSESAANPFDSLPIPLSLLILILGLGLSLGVGFISSEILLLHQGVRTQLRQLQHWNQEVEKKRLQLIEQSTLVEIEVVASEVEPYHLRNETAYYELLDRWNSTWLPSAMRPKLQALKELHESVGQSFRSFEDTLEQCKLALMDSAGELQEEKKEFQP